METSVEFRLEDFDGLSEIPVMHLTYIIQSLLPFRLIEWKTVKRHYESVLASMGDQSSEDLGDAFIVTGSMAEGYAMPYSLTRTNPPTIEKTSDVDILWVPGNMKVSTKKLQGSYSPEFKGYFEEDGLQPGYTKICLPTLKENDNSFIFDEEEKKYYLSSTVMLQKVYSCIPSMKLAESEEALIQGPAFTVVDNRIVTPRNMYEPNIGSARDLVTALVCSPWPEKANKWISRARRSPWLDAKLVESIVSDGCHVVAVPSKTALRPEVEWRISFSASEGRLAREAVTDYQRQCYIYLKILRHQVLKDTDVILSSYVFKSIFLHCCEKLPPHYWKDFPGNCVFYMLDVLLECLEKKHVPTYFLPENNLIAHLSQSELDAAIAFVVSLRIDPVTPILEYTDSRVIGYQSVIAPFREVMKPLLEDMKLYAEHRDKNTSLMKGIIGTGYNICHYLLHEQPSSKEAEVAKHQEAIRCLIDVYTLWLIPMGLNASLVQFINSAGLALKDSNISCRFFEAVVSLSAEFPEFLTVRGNLACMYHSCAYTFPDGSEKRQELLDKAEKAFQQTYNENKCSVIDYVTYLVKVKKYEAARHILEEFCEKLDGHVPVSIVYNANEQETLDEPLLQHVKKSGKIAADDISFAYFYLVKCYTALGNSGENSMQIKSILEKFELHSNREKAESTTALLHYAKSLVEK